MRVQSVLCAEVINEWENRHVSSIQKARIDVSIRQAANAKYKRVGPELSAIQSGIVPVIIEVPRDQRNKLGPSYEEFYMSLALLISNCFGAPLVV